MRKLAIEFVKVKTKEIAEGYECLSNKYVNVHSKLKFQCSAKHIYYASWNNFDNHKRRCPYCAGLKKKTIEEVKQCIEKFNYKYLGSIYKNAHTKLDLVCPNEHTYRVTLVDFQQGTRCRICYSERLRESMIGENHFNWKNYSDEDRKDLKLYKDEVVKLSNINYRLYKDIINTHNLERGRNKYHLDHIYSIIDGFNNKVLPEVIASPVNLRMLAENENISKNGTSHMTLEQLYDLHKQFFEEV